MRKGVIILSLVLLVLLSSGCVQTNPEERAIAIADQLPEVRLMSKAVDSMQRVDQCTFDKFYSEYKKISEIFSKGTPVPELTESQRGQIEGMIEEMGALVNRCQIMLSKSAEKESENMYIVHYKLETISDPECSMLSEGDIGVRVDLSTEKAEPIGGSREIEEKYVEAFDAMGDCAAILMGSVSGVSKIPQMSPAPTVALKTTTAPTITSAPTTTPAPVYTTKPAPTTTHAPIITTPPHTTTAPSTEVELYNCGNGICETGETYKECADDCVKSGVLNKDEVWGGTIHVTGDIDVIEGVTLTILPGTVIKVALTDDQHKGSDEPVTGDIYFPKDPPFYGKQKITITIRGILNAVGTPNNMIVFTSESATPTTYDWGGLDIFHGRLEYAIVEYAQFNNIQHFSDVVIANSIIRNSLGDCIGIGHSNQISPQILNNEIYNCGHEGIDYAGGSAIIKGNYFHLENPEIQPDPSRGGVGIIVYTNTYPIIEDNVFENLTNAIVFLENSKYPEQPGEKVMIKNNRLEDNIVAFRINPGYPFEVVVMENNELINNKEDEVHIG